MPLVNLAFLLLIVTLVLSRPISYYNVSRPVTGVAFAFSGAGGRISQLAALSETLINGSFPNGTAIRPSHFAGVSSGALVAVATCAILENIEQKIPSGLTFGDFHTTMFDLKNSDIFSSKVLKVISNVDDGYLLDTSPFKDFLTRMLQRVKYQTLGDLYIPTTITTVDQRTGASIRLSSTDPVHASFPLLDVLLASTAIPAAFKPASIPALSKYAKFLDGATGIDVVPVIPLLSIPAVRTIYVITYNHAISLGVIDNSLPFNVDQISLVKNALQGFFIQKANVARGALSILAQSNVTGYVLEPNFTQTFSTIDFESEEAQYKLAVEWANASTPLLVQSYLAHPAFVPNFTLIDDELAFANPMVDPIIIFTLIVVLVLSLLV